MSHDIIDTDPVRLAARTLVERIRSEEYKEGDMLGAYGPVLDYVEAVDAVMEFYNAHTEALRTEMEKWRLVARLADTALTAIHGDPFGR